MHTEIKDPGDSKPPESPVSASMQAHRLYSWLGLGLKAALAIGAVLLFLEANYQAAFETLLIMCITFLPLLGRRFKVRIPHDFETLALIFVYLSLFLGEVQGFYLRYWWWDLVLHAGSGFLVGLTGFLLVFVLNENEKINLQLTPGFIALFAFLFAIGIGVLWEIFEFAADSLLGLTMQKSGLVDTMWDLIVDCIGAFTISVLGYRYLQTEGIDSFLERMIYQFITNNPHFFRRKPK